MIFIICECACVLGLVFGVVFPMVDIIALVVMVMVMVVSITVIVCNGDELPLFVTPRRHHVVLGAILIVVSIYERRGDLDSRWVLLECVHGILVLAVVRFVVRVHDDYSFGGFGEF